ncbi:MAG: hypothetical protein DRI34_12290 [Deltaproteobacteria bacterium]|nr:MAG: hypothetical protein DRI34_12290 [Deltaproteobacteria bacterium]
MTATRLAIIIGCLLAGLFSPTDNGRRNRGARGTGPLPPHAAHDAGGEGVCSRAERSEHESAAPSRQPHSSCLRGRRHEGIRFHPTRAQQNRPRVRAARQRRLEDIRLLFAKAALDYPPRQVLLRAFKNDGVLELWVQPARGRPYVHLKDYTICMRSGELGPKRRRGDGQVPEGFYRITWFNPHSQFLLSMKVDYPNRSDRIRGGRHPGGDIFIHGSCVTIGCLPLTDRWIEELYLIALDSHWRYGRRPLVHIFPTRLDDAGMSWLEKTYRHRPELVEFWRELRPGYLYFEHHHRPAPVRIGRDGTYHFQENNGDRPAK